MLDRLRLNQQSGEGRFPSYIRRCFMTGKQCTMHSASRGTEGPSTGGASPVDFFVAMPFRDNLGTFYDWSLRPFLCASCGIPEGCIHRADEFKNVGYVTCEKICRRIQECSVMVVDISTPNPNVFYELGLAVGLGRPLLVFCERGSPHYTDKNVAEALGITWDKIVDYPNLGLLTVSNPDEKLQQVELKKRDVLAQPAAVAGQHASGRKKIPIIRPLLSPLDHKEVASYAKDIPVPFEMALTSAIGVAIQKAFSNDKEVQRALAGIGCSDPMAIANEAKPLKLRGDDKRYETFAKIAPQIDRSFAMVIDLGLENCFSYFWLGYCHARGINAIPVHRPYLGDAQPAEDQPAAKNEERILAFDIRALWYIAYEKDDAPSVLAKSLESAMVELLPRDLATVQRSLFWERLTRRRKISIFTGAVHHEDLNREVVGDWDQRTVSELVRYLSQAGESVITVLEKPVYAFETVCKKLAAVSTQNTPAGQAGRARITPEALREHYIKLVSKELENHPDCIIVASADVNPLTEVALAKAYGLNEKETCFQNRDHKPEHRMVVAMKASDAPTRSFARKIGSLPSGGRGFMWGSEEYGTIYLSQDEASKRYMDQPNPAGPASKDLPSALLGHIMVMPNPFAPGRAGTIVILNGISGPATFGLAEMLTGGAEETTGSPSKKKAKAEQMLEELNALWSAEAGFHGVEGLVQIDMSDVVGSEDGTEDKKVRAMFYDQRDVSGWKWFDPSDEVNVGKKKPLSQGNPRRVSQS